MIADIPDISVKEISNDTCYITIYDHKPLKNIKLQYICENRLWSQNYNLFYTEEYPVNNKEGKIRLIYKQRRVQWISNEDNLSDMVGKLNNNNLLNERLIRYMESGGRADIIISAGICNIRMTSLQGSITKLVIPPAVNMIKTNINEIASNIQLIQLIHSIVM